MSVPTDRPVYRVLSNFFGPDSHLYGEGDVIAFDDEPNEEMEPLNDLARDRMKAYFQKLDDCARLAATKAGREYTGRPRSLESAIALSRQDARESVPVMGAVPTVSTIAKVSGVEVPETGRRGRGRPRLSV